MQSERKQSVQDKAKRIAEEHSVFLQPPYEEWWKQYAKLPAADLSALKAYLTYAVEGVEQEKSDLRRTVPECEDLILGEVQVAWLEDKRVEYLDSHRFLFDVAPSRLINDDVAPEEARSLWTWFKNYIALEALHTEYRSREWLVGRQLHLRALGKEVPNQMPPNLEGEAIRAASRKFSSRCVKQRVGGTKAVVEKDSFEYVNQYKLFYDVCVHLGKVKPTDEEVQAVLRYVRDYLTSLGTAMPSTQESWKEWAERCHL